MGWVIVESNLTLLITFIVVPVMLVSNEIPVLTLPNVN